MHWICGHTIILEGQMQSTAAAAKFQWLRLRPLNGYLYIYIFIYTYICRYVLQVLVVTLVCALMERWPPMIAHSLDACSNIDTYIYT